MMPLDAMVVSVAVTVIFLAFAAVLLWGDIQTRLTRLNSDSRSEKRRSF